MSARVGPKSVGAQKSYCFENLAQLGDLGNENHLKNCTRHLNRCKFGNLGGVVHGGVRHFSDRYAAMGYPLGSSTTSGSDTYANDSSTSSHLPYLGSKSFGHDVDFGLNFGHFETRFK